MKWTAIEDASDAFERPVWAIEKMVAEGKLEQRIDASGRVFVRHPPTLDELASELASFLPEEVVPLEASVEPDDLEPAVLPETSREEMMLRAVFRLLERHHEQLREIRRLQEAPLALPAPPPPPPPPAPRPPRRSPLPLLVSALALVVALGAASFAQDMLESERERTDRALDHAQWLAQELIRARSAPITSGVAVVDSTTTLAAGFKR